jgi:hypothetical protein
LFCKGKAKHINMQMCGVIAVPFRMKNVFNIN